MAVRKKRTVCAPKVIASFSTYLSPLNCDSTVSYKVIHQYNRLSGTVTLADCNRKIDWFFGSSPNSVTKIDTAIGALQDFRSELVVASEAEAARKRRVKRVPKK